jgi:sulfatase modifying factor 1
MRAGRWIAVLGLVVGLAGGAPAWADLLTYEMVPVGTVDNANDTTGYGGVTYEYSIGKYDVTISQYTAFLNAVDPGGTNPYSLYNSSMGTDLNIAGISFTSGAANGSKYAVMSGSGNRPITYVSWYDAARFANWMQNGQGAGSTETGAYTLVGGQISGTAPAKNGGATFWIPTENEWYKAAYYDPTKGGTGGYWAYATKSDTAPGNTIGSAANQANYYTNGAYATGGGSYSLTQNYLTDVGAFTGSASFYGTFDQSGLVNQWNDLDGSTPGEDRAVRGGYWFDDNAFPLSSSNRYYPAYTSNEYSILGFRLASPVPVPEPSTWVMGLAGIACAGWGAYRRRKRA